VLMYKSVDLRNGINLSTVKFTINFRSFYLVKW